MENSQIQRSFIPGDEWLYYKIYTGRNSADFILTEHIKPIAEELILSKIITHWFFIRYGDPDFHLRIRFHCQDSINIGVIINRFKSSFKNLRNENFVWKVQIDTYEREIERYDVNFIGIGERIFYQDSIMILNFIQLLDNNDGQKLRWLFALRAIDSFLSSLQFQIEEKKSFLEILMTDFSKEFGIKGKYKIQIDKKYRNYRTEIENFMSFTSLEKEELAPILILLENKSIEVQNIMQPFIRQRKTGQLNKNSEIKIIGGHIHMLMNRLFKSKNRQHEMVCYDFLYRYYTSTIARSKYLKT